MYKLELDKIVEEIRSGDYKKVLIQLPDGLKVRANEIVETLEKEGVEVFVWFSSCFGACDIPSGISRFDLFVPFGHVKFNREEW